MTPAELQIALEEAANKLLNQLKHSNAFTTLGDSALAEASLVMHIAAAFSRRETAVWAESPFRSAEDDNINHVDMLVDLSASDGSMPDVLLLEAKAGAPGKRSETIKLVIDDIARLKNWSTLDIFSRPMFFYWSSIQRVRGVIAAVFTEKLKPHDGFNFELKAGSLAGWWEKMEGQLRASGTLPASLKDQLALAVWRRVVPGPVKDGGFQTFVAYAVFECENPEPSELRKTTEHEAAHAVIALGLGLRVQEVRLCDSGDQTGQFRCEWRTARGKIPESQLLTFASAVAYAGAVIDFKYRGKGQTFQDIINRLPTDTERLKEIRATAIEWGLAKDEREAFVFTNAGYELACQLIPENWHLISDLAEMLEDQAVLDGDYLANWFDAVRFAQAADNDE